MSLATEIKTTSIGQRIRHYLLLRNMSVSELSDKFGITRQGMGYKLENNAWDIPDIRKVAEILKVNITDLI